MNIRTAGKRFVIYQTREEVEAEQSAGKTLANALKAAGVSRVDVVGDIDERFVDEHTLTTSISRIRSKIESDGGAPYIKTIYGMGYQWTGGEAK